MSKGPLTVNRYTRAGKDGKTIFSGCCLETRVVYHFSWSALICPKCRGEVPKNKWIVSKYA